MTTEKKGCLAFAVCGSFCTLEDALGAAQALTAQGWTLLPVMSFAAQQDTRFGTGESWRQRLQAVTGQPVLDTLQAVEPLGPRRLAQALVVAPCTGATLSRLAAGLSDTPVTLAAKSLLRVGCPVVLAVSTNDGLGASGENIARLFQRKHYYFVPYGQDDPAAKPQSLKADFARLPAALEAALQAVRPGVVVSAILYSGAVIGTDEKQAVLAWLRALPLKDFTVLVSDFANWAETAPLPCFILKK